MKFRDYVKEESEIFKSYEGILYSLGFRLLKSQNYSSGGWSNTAIIELSYEDANGSIVNLTQDSAGEIRWALISSNEEAVGEGVGDVNDLKKDLLKFIDDEDYRVSSKKNLRSY